MTAGVTPPPQKRLPMPSSDSEARRACVFCGSSVGFHSVYRDAATQTGRVLVERGFSLVYGGGQVGLMGVIADSVLASGGRVVGVIPEFLATKELMHTGISELHTVDSMHTRKALMAELSDVFLALPGGLGTFDELCEIVTWAQLGLHARPIGLLNVQGYFDGLIQQVERAIADGFCRPEHRRLFVVDANPYRLLDAMAVHVPPDVTKWLEPGET